MSEHTADTTLKFSAFLKDLYASILVSDAEFVRYLLETLWNLTLGPMKAINGSLRPEDLSVCSIGG